MKLSETDRACAHVFLKVGWSANRVTRHFGVYTKTIWPIPVHFNQMGGDKDRARSGRPSVTTPQETRRMHTLVLRRSFTTVSKIRKQEMIQALQVTHTLLESTVRRRLHAGGLRGRRPRKRPPLKQNHRVAWLVWARAHARWVIDHWHNVMFSDDSRFCLNHVDGRMHVWCSPNEQYANCCIHETQQGGGGSVMVWGVVSLTTNS